MSGSAHAESLPRVPLVGAALLVVFAIVVVALVRFTGVGSSHDVEGRVVLVRELHFEDRPDGGIMVRDAKNGRWVADVEPGSNGFLRGTLRGLARERKRRELGPGEPFRLVAHDDGRLTLVDPATGRRVDLEAFGPTNLAAFARFIAATPVAPR